MPESERVDIGEILHKTSPPAAPPAMTETKRPRAGWDWICQYEMVAFPVGVQMRPERYVRLVQNVVL
jgi:hypothetical protein